MLEGTEVWVVKEIYSVCDGFGHDDRIEETVGVYGSEEKATDVCEKKQEAAKDHFGHWLYTKESFIVE